MEKQDWVQAAMWLATQELPVQPLITLSDTPDAELQTALEQAQGGVLASSAESLCLCTALDARTVFLSAGAPEDDLRAAHGHCRYLAETSEEIKKLDTLAGPFLQKGYLENIAIRVWSTGSGAFTAANVPEFARLIRRTENLAIRALFLPFDQDGDLSMQAKDAFSLVKKIRSDLPCMLHAFCFEGLLEPLVQGDTDLLQTLRMLASLNDTSLYATFFIS